MNNNFLTPAEIMDYTIETGVKKSKLQPFQTLLLGFLAGAFIAFASEGSNMAAFNLLSKPETYGLGKFVAGAIFPVGLILVVTAGAELFTGNTLMTGALLDRKIRMSEMLRNWFLVYIGNFIGSLLIAYLMVHSGLFDSGGHLLGGMTIKIASYKVSLNFKKAFYLGILCNWLVCLAVWMSYGSKDLIGKMFGAYFPIWLFITSGFEHSIANMYYIPAGILAKANPAWAKASGLSPEALARLNWQSFFVQNLLPVTLGNLIGGAVLVAGIYFFIYKKSR